MVDRFLAGLRSRGPDAQSSDEVQPAHTTYLQLETAQLCQPHYDLLCITQVHLGSGATLVFQASLLQLRGHTPTAPVHKDTSGNILLFNGRLEHLAAHVRGLPTHIRDDSFVCALSTSVAISKSAAGSRLLMS